MDILNKNRSFSDEGSYLHTFSCNLLPLDVRERLSEVLHDSASQELCIPLLMCIQLDQNESSTLIDDNSVVSIHILHVQCNWKTHCRKCEQFICLPLYTHWSLKFLYKCVSPSFQRKGLLQIFKKKKLWLLVNSIITHPCITFKEWCVPQPSDLRRAEKSQNKNI